MTIRKRLFWSNIMMLVIPAVLSVAISYLIVFVFFGANTVPMERAFPKYFEIVSRFQRTGNINGLLKQVEEFNGQFSSDSVFVAVAKNHVFLYPEDSHEELTGSSALFDTVFVEGITGTIIINNSRLVIEEAGEYQIVLVDLRYRLAAAESGGGRWFHPLILLAITVVVILITNRILTFLLTRRIMAPLNQLAHGAHQLRDGNLDYRIPYTVRDEFAPVCEDFNEMADQLQKLIVRQQKDEESRKELLAGISHDLRTPLTSIKAYVEGLLDGVAEDFPAQLRYLTIIRSKAEDIDRLVDKLFLFSKLEIGEYPFYQERLDIGEELEAMVTAAAEEYGGRGLRVELAENLQGVYVYADPVQLRNAITNILENSLRYKRREISTLEVHCFEKTDRVTIWLTDDGPGVPDKDLEKLFQVFYRGDPSRQNPSKGSGLGLSITSRIMKRMGGSIQANNMPGGGLRLVLELPKYAGEQEDQGEENTHH